MEDFTKWSKSNDDCKECLKKQDDCEQQLKNQTATEHNVKKLYESICKVNDGKKLEEIKFGKKTINEGKLALAQKIFTSYQSHLKDKNKIGH
ncbi:hypothetical protein BIY23_01905 [Wolbachia pipientis]|uniref:Uncharacterized protein n=1 Tax=Wolbachia pipientis TaxID=955 RepID=A0A1E7QKM3_WOLPI|nr:hypothetical protein [Wolbachia pipientis]OEY86769.1 hypothetical protein BIY23_01905 [Wolbachia pipientis]